MVVISQGKSLLIRILIVISTTAGFAYQTWTISSDYFKYPTSTLVTLQKYLNVTIGPQVGFHILNYLPIGIAVSKMFKKVNASVITRGYARTRTWARWMNGTAFRTDTFQQMEDYYITVSPPKEIRYSPEIMYLKRQSIYEIQLKTKLTTKEMSVFVHPYHADFEGLHKTDSKVDCRTFQKEKCEVSLTYSTKITRLAPPPYDTGCQDYNAIGYTSKENCISECLSEFTTRNGFVIASNVMPKEKYENSSLLLYHWYLRTMKTRAGDEVTTEYFEKQKTHEKNDDYRRMYDRIIELYYPYCNHWKSCMQRCGRSDCITETHLPVIQSATGTGDPAKLKEVYMYLFPPNDQVIIVTSQPKLILMDFIVYILSSVSFWFGFCPLNMTKKIRKVRRSRIANSQREVEWLLLDIRRRLKRVEGRANARS